MPLSKSDKIKAAAYKNTFEAEEKARKKLEKAGRTHNCEEARCDTDPQGETIVRP